MANDLDWLKLNPDTWMMSETVIGMSPLAELALFRLILLVWKKGSVPNDPAMCLKLINRTLPIEAIEEALKGGFKPSENDPSRLIHERTARDFNEAMASREKFREYGAKGGKQSAKQRATPDKQKKKQAAQKPPLSHPKAPLVPPSSKAQATLKQREGEGEGEEEYTPLPPDSGTPASTEGEGEGISQAEAEARHHREYCRKEAKGLPKAFLDDGAFRDAWCDWVAHLKARHHKGFNPPFTTVSRHKEQIRMHSVADATWALKEGIRRNLPFPADPAKRAAGSSSGSVDLMSAAAPLKNPIPTDYYDPLEVCGLQSPPPERQRRRAEPSA